MIVVDGAIGETRIATFEGDRVVEVTLRRWSDEGRRAALDSVHAARVTRLDSSLRGAFLALDEIAEPAFLPLRSREPPPVEGARVRVAIVREGARGKSPVARLIAADAPNAQPAAPMRPQPAPPALRAAIDEALEAALAPCAAIPGGGALIIEPTAALVAIDVDSAGRSGARDGERFALDLNRSAAAEAMRQLRLRNLGGVVAIDFVSQRSRASSQAVREAARAAAAADPWGVQMGEMSRFGVLLLTRGQKRRPHHEVLRCAAGRLTAETEALTLLRAMEREAGFARGRIVVGEAAAATLAWLEAETIPWRAALAARSGGRFRLQAVPSGQPRAFAE